MHKCQFCEKKKKVDKGAKKDARWAMQFVGNAGSAPTFYPVRYTFYKGPKYFVCDVHKGMFELRNFDEIKALVPESVIAKLNW